MWNREEAVVVDCDALGIRALTRTEDAVSGAEGAAMGDGGVRCNAACQLGTKGERERRLGLVFALGLEDASGWRSSASCASCWGVGATHSKKLRAAEYTWTMTSLGPGFGSDASSVISSSDGCA